MPNENVNRSGMSPWPDNASRSIAFLLDVRDDFEARLLRDWVDAERTESDDRPRYSFTKLPKGPAGKLLDALAAADDDVWIQPLRIAWLPSARRAGRFSVQDIFFGRITEPGAMRRRWLAKHRPERVARIAGDGARLGELRERLACDESGANKEELSEFIANQALITLERSERSLRGARYKVSRIRPSDVFANADFRTRMASVAQRRDSSVRDVQHQAERYLREMAATQTPFTVEIMNTAYRTACHSHHDAGIDINEEQLETVAQIIRSRPVVFLISHKSMLDTAALSLVLFEANLPLPLTFGGINLNKPGLGALARRAGIIFLRRSFQDNEIYKATFRRYIDYLIEKRFSLLWALEGTRSRTGKLLPPRFGLFNYVLESILRTRLYDVTFIPVSVAYDQITEVEDYSIEQRGQTKKPEGIMWPLRFLKRGRSRGQIHLRFGEGLTIKELVEPDELEAGIDDLQKQVLVPTLAFEVAVRMNAATPITATAIVTLILLAGGNRAQSLNEIQAPARAGAALIRRRHLEIVGRADFRDPRNIAATLAELHATGIVSYHDEGTERLYSISADQHLNAAYYRNTAIHYFILDAFVEIALLDAASAKSDRSEAFFARTSELRELFKFEFYLPRRADYRSEIERRVSDRFESWKEALQGGEAGVREAFEKETMLVAHGVLRSFADAYRVAAIVLAEDGEAVDNKNAFLSRCLKTGKQELLQGRVFSAESISKPLYESGWKLADYRGLLAAEQAEARSEFHEELRCIKRRLDEVLTITNAVADKL